jgi:hypothetical protein
MICDGRRPECPTPPECPFRQRSISTNLNRVPACRKVAKPTFAKVKEKLDRFEILLRENVDGEIVTSGSEISGGSQLRRLRQIALPEECRRLGAA